MQMKPCLTFDDARRVMAAAQDEAAKNQWAVSIAIVDDHGSVILLERRDRANPQSPEIATLKAKTAALSGKPTRDAEAMVKDRPVMVSFPGRLMITGGLPVMHEGVCIGGIGVSGVKSDEDEQIAAAGLKAL
ncbi:MAG: heme-binding protein [Bryobacteraceae bacterium]